MYGAFLLQTSSEFRKPNKHTHTHTQIKITLSKHINTTTPYFSSAAICPQQLRKQD